MTEEGLNKLNDEELEKIIIQGNNLHIHTSEASVAKRILENRRSRKQVEEAENISRMVEQLGKSNVEIKAVVSNLSEVISILNFLKQNWFPKKSFLFKICAFLLTTVALGISLNLIASAIIKFIFHW